MRELENRIAAWRETMAAELPAETVRELEGHLRDQIEDMVQTGMTSGQAFVRATERLGEGRVLAREFERGGSRWFGSVHSAGARFMAATAGVLGLVVVMVYVPMIFILIDRQRSGRLMQQVVDFFEFNIALLGAFIVLSGAAVHAANRFLRAPTARDARMLAAYNLLIVWMLSGYAMTRTGLSYWPKAVVGMTIFAALALLWRTWANHYNETQTWRSEHA